MVQVTETQAWFAVAFVTFWAMLPALIQWWSSYRWRKEFDKKCREDDRQYITTLHEKITAMQQAILLMGDAIEHYQDTVPHEAVRLSLEHDFELFRDDADDDDDTPCEHLETKDACAPLSNLIQQVCVKCGVIVE